MNIQDKITRENVLKNIRNASLVRVDNPFSNVNQETEIYSQPADDDLLVQFATELSQIGGSFVYCIDSKELTDELKVLMQVRNIDFLLTLDPQLSKIFQNAGLSYFDNYEKVKTTQVIATSCEALVARLGSVVVSSKQVTGRLANFIPDVHIVVATQNQVVATVRDAVDLIRKKYNVMPSLVSFITGPSRTADIEKTLVMGAHGPRELIVFVLENF